MATMIGCPSCARSVPLDAVVCPYCAKSMAEQPAPATQKSTSVGIWVLGILGAIVVVSLMTKKSPTSSSEVILNVTASRGTNGLQLVNREGGSINTCDVTLLDVGSDQWIAPVPGPLARMQSVHVPWSTFTAAGQPMPASIGQNRKYFTVSCLVGTEQVRRSAGLSF